MLAMRRIAPTSTRTIEQSHGSSALFFVFFVIMLHVPRDKYKEGQSLLEINICI